MQSTTGKMSHSSWIPNGMHLNEAIINGPITRGNNTEGRMPNTGATFTRTLALALSKSSPLGMLCVMSTDFAPAALASSTAADSEAFVASNTLSEGGGEGDSEG